MRQLRADPVSMMCSLAEPSEGDGGGQAHSRQREIDVSRKNSAADLVCLHIFLRRSIIRAFLVEEAKIVKAVLASQKAKK